MVAVDGGHGQEATVFDLPAVVPARRARGCAAARVLGTGVPEEAAPAQASPVASAKS